MKINGQNTIQLLFHRAKATVQNIITVMPFYINSNVYLVLFRKLSVFKCLFRKRQEQGVTLSVPKCLRNL